MPPKPPKSPTATSLLPDELANANAVDSSLQERQPIQLRRIVWKKPVELAGPASSQGSVRTTPSGSTRQEYVLEWYPWLRHFRVVCVRHGISPEDAETWVHESNASSWRRILKG